MLYPSTFWPPFHGDLRWPRSYRALVPYWYFANIFRIADMLHFADHAAMFQEFSSAHAAIGYAGFEGCSKNHRPCSQARSQGPLASLPYMFRSSMHEGAQKQTSQAASGSQRHMGVAMAHVRSIVRPQVRNASAWNVSARSCTNDYSPDLYVKSYPRSSLCAQSPATPRSTRRYHHGSTRT